MKLLFVPIFMVSYDSFVSNVILTGTVQVFLNNRGLLHQHLDK